MGQVVRQSQPRYVNQSGTPFWQYAPLASDAEERWTTTQYDGLGRATNRQAPDGTSTSMAYSIYNNSGNLRRAVTTYDANQHAKRQESDMFGRLLTVAEYQGTGPYSNPAYTNYLYSPLDLLTGVTDAYGKTTASMQYDSLGRKKQMTDLTMGTWQYGYDPNGNLTQQTDAKGQQITFSYDELDRLRRKDYSGGGSSVYE